MREVFENIAEHAMVHVPGQTGLHTRAFSLEKFGELIVQECANIVASSSLPDAYSEPALSVIAEQIKQHFGIENG